MSIEILERAVARLEELKAGAATLPWEVETIPETGESRILSEVTRYEVVPNQMNAGDALFVVALSRTVDPLIELLRFARSLFGAQIQGEQAAATADLAAALARAVLGERDGE